MTKQREQIEYRPVRIAGALLILQCICVLGLGLYKFSRVDWDRALTFTSGQGQINVQTVDGPWLKPLEQALLFAIFFLLPIILLLLAGLSFLIFGRRGWLLATTAQSLILLVCIFAYPDPRPAFAYLFIAYCILMVLYLNSRSVRAAVHSKRNLARRRSGTVHEP